MTDIMEFHMLIPDETHDAQIKEVEESTDNKSVVEIMVRRKGHSILRITASSESYMFFLLKYGKDNVWKR